MRCLKSKDMEKELKIFQSVAEMLRFIENSTKLGTYLMEDDDVYRRHRKWFGVASYDKAKELLKYGYKADVNQELNVPIFSTTGERKVNTIGMVGYAPHVPNAINGLPLCMRTKKKVEVRNKVVDLYFNATFGKEVDFQTIKEKGERMIQIIKEHESKGVRVNLYVAASAYDFGKHQATIVVKYKDAKHPLNVSRLYYPLMHPSFLRVFLFRVWNRMQCHWDSNYYVANDLTKILGIDGQRRILI